MVVVEYTVVARVLLPNVCEPDVAMIMVPGTRVDDVVEVCEAPTDF